VLIWAVLMLLANVLFIGLIVSFAGEAFMAVAAGSAGETDPEEALRNMGELAPVFLLIVPLAILFSAVMTGAIYRAVLRPGDGGPSYVRFGGDELQLAGTMLLLGLLLVGLTFVLALGLTLVGAALGAAGGGGGAGAIALLLPLLLLVLLVFFGVRLSFALPATFAEGRIRVFDTWRLTKGRFWPLLGMYVLAAILALVIYLLAMMIYLAVAALVGGGFSAAASVFRPDYTSFATLMSVPYVLFTLVTALVSAVTTAITTAPAMAAYRDITGHGRDTAEVFS
jgi:hypothetical protein